MQRIFPFLATLALASCNLFSASEPGDATDVGEVGDVGLIDMARVDMPVAMDLGGDDATADVAADVASLDMALDATDVPDIPIGPSGGRVISGGVGLSTEVTLDVPIGATVDPDQSFLVFSSTSSGEDPSNAMLRGELVNGNTIHFARYSTSAPIDVRWSVVELPQGSVQHVTECYLATTGCANPDIPLNPLVLPIDTVDLDNTFPLLSNSSRGLYFESGDFPEVRLLADQLEVHFSDATADAGRVTAQILTIPGASVQSGQLAFAPADLSKEAALQPTDPDRTVVLATWQVEPIVSYVGPHSLNAHANRDTLTIERLIGGADVSATWYAVELPVGYEVVQVRATMDASTTELMVDIPAVPAGRSFVMLSGNMRSGATSYLGESMGPFLDAIGSAWMTVELVDDGSQLASQVRARRWLTADAPADATFYVVTVP